MPPPGTPPDWLVLTLVELFFLAGRPGGSSPDTRRRMDSRAMSFAPASAAFSPLLFFNYVDVGVEFWTVDSKGVGGGDRQGLETWKSTVSTHVIGCRVQGVVRSVLPTPVQKSKYCRDIWPSPLLPAASRSSTCNAANSCGTVLPCFRAKHRTCLRNAADTSRAAQ